MDSQRIGSNGGSAKLVEVFEVWRQLCHARVAALKKTLSTEKQLQWDFQKDQTKKYWGVGVAPTTMARINKANSQLICHA